MKHGTSNTYLRKGCRCEPCKAAEAERKRRTRRRKDEKFPRHRAKAQWPLDAILALVPDSKDRLEIDSTVWNRCATRGMSDRTADHWCVRLGYHPVSVFGWEWITRGLHPLDDLFVYGSDTAEPGWRQAAVWDGAA